jgi:hypothetical protein
MQRLRSSLLSFRDLLATAGPFVLVAALALWGAYRMVDPSPPHTLVMATGPANSDYDAFGQRYRALLARHGIRLELRHTSGSRDNLDALRAQSGGVDVAFVRGGTASAEEIAESDLVSLGSLFYEPVWLFHRDTLPIGALTDLRARAVNLGPPGSGTARLVGALLAQNQVDPGELQASQFENTEAVVALLEGRIDALFFTSASDGLMIQMLLRTPGVRLFDVAQAEAYTRRLPTLSHVVLPRGVVDLARDMPSHDVHLVAPTSTLLARAGTHPALVELLVQSAHEIHGRADWFARQREFPSAQTVEFPLADEARRYYRSGPPFLQRYLPFWLANLIDRMWVVVVSLAALLIPLSRIVPPLYQWRIRSRIYRWYGQLRTIEREASRPLDERGVARTGELLERLGNLEARVNEIVVPLSHADELYFLRQHIELVRAKLGP